MALLLFNTHRRHHHHHLQRRRRRGAVRAPRRHRGPPATVHGRGRLHAGRRRRLHRHGAGRTLPGGRRAVREGGGPRAPLLPPSCEDQHHQEGLPPRGPGGAVRGGVEAGRAGSSGSVVVAIIICAARALLCGGAGGAGDDAGAGRVAGQPRGRDGSAGRAGAVVGRGRAGGWGGGEGGPDIPLRPVREFSTCSVRHVSISNLRSIISHTSPTTA